MFDWITRRHRPRATSMPSTTTNSYTRIDPDVESLDTPTLHDNHRVGTSARLRQLFSGIERNWIAFFIFGCINNLIYVVILSAAVDLVGSKVPKGVVLLADITPSLLIKTVAPYFVHKVPYTIRVVFCAFLSFSAVVLIAQADSISVRLLGVMMASLSSGLGELTFLMLSSFYRLQMVSAWSSGTGGAGLLGALLFLALTSWIGLSIPRTLAVVSLFPIMMLVAYFVILTSPQSSGSSRHHSAGYRPLSNSIQLFTDSNNNNEEHLVSTNDPQQNLPRPSSRDPKPTLSPLPQSVHSLDQQEQDHSNGNGGSSNTEGEESSVLPSSSSDHASPLLPNNNDHSSTTSSSRGSFAVPMIPSWDITAPSWEAQAPQQLTHTEPTSINTLLAATDPDDPGFVPPFREIEEGGLENTDGGRRRVYKVQPNEAMTMQEKRAMARSLLVPFMFPLFLVYFAEYTMNQGVLPVVLYPLEKTPFTHLRDHYVTYSAIYQLGVFISRSSASVIEIPRLWIPSFLQFLTLLLATSQAILTTVSSSPPTSSPSSPPSWLDGLTSLPMPLPSIYMVFILIFWEGLLGGATYVHTYIGISKDLEHDPRGKEFALGVVGVADGLGILLAGLASLWIEPTLCRWQVVERGVQLCLSMAD